ncbi:unnamed protein product, partial [Callosobruchus maculatus]
PAQTHTLLVTKLMVVLYETSLSLGFKWINLKVGNLAFSSIGQDHNMYSAVLSTT